MDYQRPVEEIIPGVQGRVLGVLARTQDELTIRTVARLAGASPQQASVVVGRLVELGVVARREAGPSALVRLERENEVARMVLALAEAREVATRRLIGAAQDIDPVPANLILFGSFARGDANASSDLDVLAVRPDGVGADNKEWIDSLGKWEVSARKIVGNPVKMLVVGEDELPGLLGRRSGPWRAIAEEGVALVGLPLDAHATVA